MRMEGRTSRYNEASIHFSQFRDASEKLYFEESSHK